MSDNRLEWIPFHYERFLVSTFGWSAEEIGAYLLLLCHQWDKGFIPVELDEIRKITRTHHRKNIDKVVAKFPTHAETQANEEGKEYDTAFIEHLKSTDKRANQRLYIIRKEKVSIVAKNRKSGSEGGKARARNQANAKHSLDHKEVEQEGDKEQNEIKNNAHQKNSTHGQESKTGTEAQNTGATQKGETTQIHHPQAQETSSTYSGAEKPERHVVAHWKRLSESPQQLDAFAMSSRKQGLFPKDMPADQCRAGIIKYAEDYQLEFDKTCSGGDYTKFGYRLSDHLKKLAADPGRKPWEAPKTTTLNYTLPVNKSAQT